MGITGSSPCYRLKLAYFFSLGLPEDDGGGGFFTLFLLFGGVAMGIFPAPRSCQCVRIHGRTSLSGIVGKGKCDISLRGAPGMLEARHTHTHTFPPSSEISLEGFLAKVFGFGLLWEQAFSSRAGTVGGEKVLRLSWWGFFSFPCVIFVARHCSGGVSQAHLGGESGWETRIAIWVGVVVVLRGLEGF